MSFGAMRCLSSSLVVLRSGFMAARGCTARRTAARSVRRSTRLTDLEPRGLGSHPTLGSQASGAWGRTWGRTWGRNDAVLLLLRTWVRNRHPTDVGFGPGSETPKETDTQRSQMEAENEAQVVCDDATNAVLLEASAPEVREARLEVRNLHPDRVDFVSMAAQHGMRA